MKDSVIFIKISTCMWHIQNGVIYDLVIMYKLTSILQCNIVASLLHYTDASSTPLCKIDKSRAAHPALREGGWLPLGDSTSEKCIHRLQRVVRQNMTCQMKDRMFTCICEQTQFWHPNAKEVKDGCG